MVHQLISAYKLMEHCYHIPVPEISEDDLRKFHSLEYIEFIKKISNKINDCENDEFFENFGFNYDCPVIDDLLKTIILLASSSIAAAKAIINGQCHYVINWFGGWHHGFKDEASGYCYTNDIVFAILTFLENKYNKILYIDLDLHHGNGVEEAFCFTNKVLTFSLHKYEFGFFPGTGSIKEIGLGNRGKYYSINMPLENGISDTQYTYIFDTIIKKIMSKYQAQVIICQCGADTLSGDRMSSFNLTLSSYEHCLETLMSFNTPLMLLGGGGYNLANTSKLWTLLTSKVIGKKLEKIIPDHELFLYYGPDYELSITESLIPNNNNEQNIEEKLKIILQNIDQIL